MEERQPLTLRILLPSLETVGKKRRWEMGQGGMEMVGVGVDGWDADSGMENGCHGEK